MADQNSNPPLRTIPCDKAAEAAVLASMIVDPACIGDVVEKITVDSFYHDEHMKICQAILALWEKSPTGIDGLLVRKELENRKWLEEIGGTVYLQQVLDSVPSAANAVFYADIVRDKALARALIKATSDSLREAYESGDIAQTIEAAEERIYKVSERRIIEQSERVSNLVVQAYESIEKREGNTITGLATRFYELDDLTCGLQNGEMLIVAGRPSMGKTALALNIAERLAVMDKIPVAIFSLEMSKKLLTERFLCSLAGVDSQLVRKGMLGTEAYQKLVEAVTLLSSAPLFIDDSAAMTPMELRAKARRLARKEGIKCIIVDYLQLMQVNEKTESRQQEITAISRHIKAVARELNIPVIVLSQLNRAPEGREDHRPRMSDLRESGSIEQDADVVMLLHREDYYHRGDPEYHPDGTAEIILAKQRNGPTGIVKLLFRDQCTRFENLSQANDNPFQGD